MDAHATFNRLLDDLSKNAAVRVANEEENLAARHPGCRWLGDDAPRQLFRRSECLLVHPEDLLLAKIAECGDAFSIRDGGKDKALPFLRNGSIDLTSDGGWLRDVTLCLGVQVNVRRTVERVVGPFII